MTEHVCIAYELARDVLAGKPGVGSAPWFLRPIIRTFFLKPVLKTGRFRAGAKAPASFQPTGSPASAVELVARLRAAADAFGSEVNAAGREGRTTVDHPLFGKVPLSDYSRLQAIHTRHHAAQLGGDPK